MAIRFVEEAWKEYLRCPATFRSDGGHGERFYLDFRQAQYPELAGSALTYTLVTPGDNQPGSHNATGGHADYFVALEEPMTLHVRFKPTFPYDVATDQVLVCWVIDATHKLTVYYSAANDRYEASWQDGGTARTLEGPVHTGSGTLQVWTNLDLVFGDTSPALMIDEIVVDSSWSGTADALSSSFPRMSLRHDGAGNEGGYTINHVRLFPGVAVDTATVALGYRNVWDEEIHWSLDGFGLGRTRCNVTDRVTAYSLKREAEKKKTGCSCANTLGLTLNNRSGLFSDNQYATYDPGNRQYNGTTDQRYMQRRCRVICESWYGKKHEPFFVGRVDESLFKRTTILTHSTVKIEAEDAVADMARVQTPDNVYYEDAQFCDPANESASLIHLVVRLGSQVTVENMLANSGFENATISNSWEVSGAGAALSRAAGGLLGSYEAQLAYGSADAEMAQTVTFLDKTSLNVGERYVASVWLKAPADASVYLTLEERDSSGLNDSTTSPESIAGGVGWVRYSVTHQITDETSDRLKFRVILKTNTTLSVDCAMLSRGTVPVDWDVLNSDDGASAVASADAMEKGLFDTLGFDVDEEEDIHPWAVIEDPWDTLQDIADATAAWIMGIDSAGTFLYRTPFKPGFTDPTPVGTLTSTWEVASEVEDDQPNAVIIRGIKIVKDTNVREVWNAIDTQEVNPAFSLWAHGLAAGGIYPDPTYWPDFWAKYEDIQITKKKTRKWWQWHSRTKITRVKKNDKDAEVVGVKTPSLVYNCTRPFAYPTWNSEQLPLTQLIFDTTTRIDQAQFRLRNDNGFPVMVWGSSIRGLLVQRLSGESGYTHDKFRDPDAIRLDGEIAFEVENNFIVSQDQCDRLADHGWKECQPKKHSYEIPQVGAALYLEPGDWHTLEIGNPGEAEYIDSVVRLMSIEVRRGCRNIGETKIGMREVQENWIYDSTAFARSLATGRYEGGRESVIVVAASKYMGPASRYCDGTNDEDEIIDALQEGRASGRPVQLTPGTFHTSGKITVPSNVTLLGSGTSTIIYSDGAEMIIEYEQDGIGISVDSMTIQNGEMVNYRKLAVHFNGALKSTLQRCVILFAGCAGVSCDGDFNKVMDNVLSGGRDAADAYDLVDTETVKNAATYYEHVARLRSDLAVVVWSDGVNGIYAKVMSTTGDAIQCGDEQTIAAPGSTSYVVDGVAALDESHFVVTAHVSGFNTITAWACEIGLDEETITPGGAVNMTTHGTGGAVAGLAAGLFVVTFRDSSSPFYQQFIACTVSGTTITAGTPQVADSSGACQAALGICRVSDTQFVGTYLLTADWGVYVIGGTVSGTTITFGAKVLAYDGTSSSAWGYLCALSDGRLILAVGTSSSTVSVFSATIDDSSEITLYDDEAVDIGNPTVWYISAAEDDRHFLITYAESGVSKLRVGKAYGSRIVLEAAYQYYAGAGARRSTLLSSQGGIIVLYATPVPSLVAYLINIIVEPDAIRAEGSGNIVRGNHVLGIEDYTEEVAIYAAGDDNLIAENQVDGLVGADRLIEGGVVIAASGKRNSVVGNRVMNCEAKGILNSGDYTHFGTNVAYNNGGDTGAEIV